MKFWSLFKKKLKKNKTASTVEQFNMINLNNSIKVPSRRELNEVELRSFKSYRKSYEYIIKETIKQNRTLLPIDLECCKLQNSLEIYISLLLNLFDEKNELRNTTNTTKILKLNLYLSDITSLKKEALLRLKALREIYKTHVFLPKRNRETLLNEISILENDYLIFKCQEEHAIREIDTYKKEHSLDTSIQTSEEQLMPKLNELYMFVSMVSKEDADKIQNSKISTEIKIAFFEKLLEMFVYKNKEKLRLLDEKFDKLNEYEVTSQNRDNLLKTAKRIEDYYKIFYYFGGFLVSDEQLNKLYQFKYKLLTSDMYEKWNMQDLTWYKNTMWFKEIQRNDPLEIKYYKKILESILENITKGNNKFLEEQFKEDTKEVIDLIMSYCKDKDMRINFQECLYNPHKFLLLNATRKKNGIREYFKKELVRCSIDKFSQLEGKIIDWKKVIPLESDFLIWMYNEQTHPSYLRYKIFKLLEKNKTKSDTYKLPEGIISIKGSKLYLRNIDLPILTSIKKELENAKNIILPSTLINIDSEFLISYINSTKNIDSIVLNDGLKSIEIGYEYLHIKTLVIPSSLEKYSEKVGGCSPCESTVDTIIFKDYEDSQILRNDENLQLFFNRFLFKLICNLEFKIILISRDSYKDNIIIDDFREIRNMYTQKHQTPLPTFPKYSPYGTFKSMIDEYIPKDKKNQFKYLIN